MGEIRGHWRYVYKCGQCNNIVSDPAQYDPCQKCGGEFRDRKSAVRPIYRRSWLLFKRLVRWEQSGP